MKLHLIEEALKAGNLWARMANNRTWVLRRNGATKMWKRDPSRFEIPVKAGLRACARINETSVVEQDSDGKWIVESV